jgi:ribosomal protein S18 acetylase RimI-like enzyme
LSCGCFAQGEIIFIIGWVYMPETPYIIRPAVPLDYAAINQVCLQAYEEFAETVGPENWRQMQKVLSQAAELAALGELLVAEESFRIQGVVLYTPPGRSDGVTIPSEWASIRTLAVSPSFRGRGIGRRLVEECIERARKDGAEQIGLSTADMMAVAVRMYERMGFKKVAELGTRLGVRNDRYALRL